MQPIVIIGTGLAGYSLAREFRKLDGDTPLLLISTDDGSAYAKPMLSNAFAQGKDATVLAQADAPAMAAQLNARILTHTQVDAIDTNAHQLIANGESIGYSKLVLAVGAKPIQPLLEGDAAEQALQVNSLADYAHFRQQLDGKQRVAVIGAGLIGCEFANDLVNAGYRVSVLGRGETPLDNLIPALAGQALQTGLAAAGVQWRLGSSARAVERDGDALRLVLDRGAPLRTDLVLSAIGLRPNTHLADAAGIETGRGIVTDAQLRTSAQDVYALGDCAEVAGVLRLYVMPIMHGARALARTLAGNVTTVSYPLMPVAIKTPAHPVVLGLADGASKHSEWRCESETGGTRCLRHAGDVLNGFCLSGDLASERQQWLKRLAAVGHPIS